MALPANETQNSLKLLYDVSRELATALDLRTVLQRVLSRSLEIVEGNTASIIILDEQGKPVDAAIITDGKVHEGTLKRLESTLDSGLAGWVVRNREAVMVSDTRKDPRWAMRSYSGSEENNPKSSLCAPIMARERLVGVITFTHPQVNFYTQEHLQLVQAIADQAAIAALNARLYEANQRRADVMEVLAESAASITATLDISEVLNRILELMSEYLEVESVSLRLKVSESEDLVFQFVSQNEHRMTVGHRTSQRQGVASWVMAHKEAIIVPDVPADPRFGSEIDLEAEAPRAVAAAPVLAEGEVIGVLKATNPRAPFSADDLVLLKGIGGLAGTAIRHARLFDEVQAAQVRFRQLFEDSIDPILITNRSGEILQANRQASLLSGYERERLLKMNVHHLHQVDWAVVGQEFCVLDDDEAVSYRASLQPQAGEPIPVEVYVHKIDIGGEERLQWIMHDITELKKVDQVREDLVSMIYHDLRSPLANVTSGLDLIAQIVPENPEVRTLIDIATRSTDRVQRLVSSLLDTSRLQAGQKITTQQAVPLAELIEDVIAIVRPAANVSRFTLEVELPDGLPKVLADADMIRRVLINLVENAMKYSPERSTIRLGAKRQEGWAHIWVRDEGRGISAEDQVHIFDKFMRVGSAPRKTRGLGLGLAFCKLAVEGHGGRIWVESAPEKGSTFTFTLPVAE